MHIMDAEKYAQYRRPSAAEADDRNFGSRSLELHRDLKMKGLTEEEIGQIFALGATRTLNPLRGRYTSEGYEAPTEEVAEKYRAQLAELHRILDTGIEVI